MFSISASDIFHIGRPSDGKQFTQFVDSLLRVHCRVHAAPLQSLSTNLRINKQDGGVDTRLDVTVAGDAKATGWLTEKTIWQYKATESSGINESDLKEAVGEKAWYARECIKNGYAYRFCICDSIPDSKKQDWETKLTTYIRAINPDAPEAKVLTADDLAAWANDYLGLVLTYFLPHLQTKVQHLNAWREGITRDTPHYIPVPDWQPVQQKIARFVDFQAVPAEVDMTIQGEAGVGKTRLVYEALMQVEGIEGLVIYADDSDRAIEIARLLANDSSRRAILVADECLVAMRWRLRTILAGCSSRVRIVTIDNSGESLDETPEYWLRRIPEDVLDKILNENFPEVPIERRRAYARLSGGFVRLAADICRNDMAIAAGGYAGPNVRTIREYYRKRLSEEEREVLEALALFDRIGFREDISGELDALCSFLSLTRKDFVRIANRLHSMPGYIARAGRYYYVTPTIIAHIAFEYAWNRWAASDVETFLSQVPEALLQKLLKRSSNSASEEVRRLIGEFFRVEAHQFSPDDLSDAQKVSRIVTLIKTAPEAYLPLLRRVIDDSTEEQLLATANVRMEDWDVRRNLVWLVERLAAFPEYFKDAEAILLKLALAEAEPGIGNNATGIWKQLFRILLSGASVPFSERLPLLQYYVFSADEAVSNLGLEAFETTFDPHPTLMRGPAVVAGKIAPASWKPKNRAEYHQCLTEAITLLQSLVTSGTERLAQRAYGIVRNHLWNLLSSGLVSQVSALYAKEIIPDEVRGNLISSIQEFLYFNSRHADQRERLAADYILSIRRWLETLQPVDFHGRLVATIGVDPWRPAEIKNEADWEREVRELAVAFLADPALFENEIAWLYSPEAHSAAILGHELGKLDIDAKYLVRIVDASIEHQAFGLAKGYIQSVLQEFPIHQPRINSLLDSVQEEHPTIAYELFIVGGEATQALTRTFRLIDTGKLPAIYLKGFLYRYGDRDFTTEELSEALTRLLKAHETGDTNALRVAIDLMGLRSQGEDAAIFYTIEESQTVPEIVWNILEAAVSNVRPHDAYWWARILEKLRALDAGHVAKIATNALIGTDLYMREEATKVLLKAAEISPEVVVEEFGKVLLDEEKGWHFYIGNYQELIDALPEQTIVAFLRSKGIKAAQRLARHLPDPHLDEEGNTVVPPLTAFILTEFAEDREVFQEFLAGRHSMQMYSGDIAAQHEEEAVVARKFLNHTLPRIREWAKYEIEHSQQQAKWWRRRQEEDMLLEA